MAAELRLQDEEAGERGLGEPEVLGANQEVSHVASEGTDLTEAIGVAETERRQQNGRRTTTEINGRAQSEREGEGDRLRAQLSGGVGASECVRAREKGSGAWGRAENVRSWARPRRRVWSVRARRFRHAGPTEQR